MKKRKIISLIITTVMISQLNVINQVNASRTYRSSYRSMSRVRTRPIKTNRIAPKVHKATTSTRIVSKSNRPKNINSGINSNKKTTKIVTNKTNKNLRINNSSFYSLRHLNTMNYGLHQNRFNKRYIYDVIVKDFKEVKLRVRTSYIINIDDLESIRKHLPLKYRTYKIIDIIYRGRGI